MDLLPEAPRLIGLNGPIGSGKSTTAAILAGWGYVRLEFAAPLKAAIRAILRADGLTAGQVETLVTGAGKDGASRTFCGRTMRHVRQSLGTEWGRDLIGADLWAGIAVRRICEELALGRRVVVEDVRFANEAAAIRAAGAGAEIWQLTGRGGAQGAAGAHVSEGLEIGDPDLILHNSGSREALEVSVLEYILG